MFWGEITSVCLGEMGDGGKKDGDEINIIVVVADVVLVWSQQQYN